MANIEKTAWTLVLLLAGGTGGLEAQETRALECVRTEAAESTVSELERTFARWRHAVAKGDTDALAELVTADAEFWTHGQPPLKGRSALRSAFEPLFSGFTVEQAFACEELIAAGDLAFLRGTEVNRLTSRESGEARTSRQRAFSILRREPDGVWRFARGMTNLPPDEDSSTGS